MNRKRNKIDNNHRNLFNTSLEGKGERNYYKDEREMK